MYLQEVLAHLMGSMGKSVVIFFDNIDKKSDAMQEEAYMLASRISREWLGVLVFVVLRPGTFYQSLSTGVLDSIAHRSYFINPPEARIVLHKRLQFACSIARGETSGVGKIDSNTSFELPSVEKVLKCFDHSIQKSNDIIQLINKMANGNIRDLLHRIRNVLLCQHFNTKEIIDKFDENGSYIIPAHHIQKALLFGGRRDYYPSESIFHNLFQTMESGAKTHYIQNLILSYLNQYVLGDDERRFVKKQDLLTYLFNIGYTDRNIADALSHLFKNQCIEGSVHEIYPESSNAGIRRARNLFMQFSCEQIYIFRCNDY